MTAIVVTWNRVGDVRRVVDDLAGQSVLLGGWARRVELDIVVVDNASDDDTWRVLHDEHPSSRTLENRASSGVKVTLTRPMPHLFSRGEPGFPELTIIRNRLNLGGCGGFNTGMSFVHARRWSPDFVWLVDDDARLPDDALAELLGPVIADESIAFVGSRTVDARDRSTTVETTIYFDRGTGFMRDSPPPSHPMHAAHASWRRAIGEPARGVASADPRSREGAGVIEVDVASACSLLARWSAAERIGPWDESFFLYCDDADWCLRARAAGHRVVSSLGARAFHAPWHAKLTPTRDYYAKRNALWMHRRALAGGQLRRLAWRWPVWLAKDAVRHWRGGRKLSAWMTLRALLDATLNRGGPIPDGNDGSPPSVVSFAAMLAVSVGLSLATAPWVRRRPSPRWGVEKGSLQSEVGVPDAKLDRAVSRDMGDQPAGDRATGHRSAGEPL